MDLDYDSDSSMDIASEDSLSDSEKEVFCKSGNFIVYVEDLDDLITSNSLVKKNRLNELVSKIIDDRNCLAFKNLIGFGYRIKPMDATGQTALHLAFHKNYYMLLEDKGKLFFDWSTDKNQNYVDSFGLSYFHIACDLGNLPVVERYLRINSVDVNAAYCNEDSIERTSGTPLQLAIISHRLKVVQLLIEHGADVNVIDLEGNTCLHLASLSDNYHDLSCWNDDLEIFKLIVGSSNFINSRDSADVTPMLEIFNVTWYQFEDTLFSNSNDDETVIVPQETLTIKPKIRQKEKLQILLEHGADVTAKDKDANTILHKVIQDMESLRCAGDLVPSFDDTLHLAMVKLVLGVNQNLDINGENIKGYTPLQLALNSMSFKMVQLLLEHGACLSDLRFAQGSHSFLRYPMIYLTLECVQNLIAIVELLTSKGFKISNGDNSAILKILVHNNSEYCQCHDVVELNDGLEKCSEILSFSTSNHTAWLGKALDFKKCRELDLYLEHLKYGGFYVDQKTVNIIEKVLPQILQAFGRDLPATNFEPEIEEIKRMKCITLRQNVSLYDVLKKHPYKIYPYIADNDLTFLKHFSRYESFIKGHITKSLIRHYCENSAHKYLKQIQLSLQYPCLQTITSYLSNEDILSLSQAMDTESA